MPQPTLVIKQQKSLTWLFASGLIAVAVLILSYYLGQYFAASDLQKNKEEVLWLKEKLNEYQQAYQKANENLVMQEQSAKVDTQSRQQLVETIKQMQDNQLKLDEELKFYRRIMTPSLTTTGLTIDEFKITKIPNGNAVKFKLVLTQTGKQDRFLRGNTILKLQGKLNNENITYNFNELGTFKKKHFQFQFRYFQNIEGELVIPDGFVVQRVDVYAKTRGLRKNQTKEQQFEWNI